jgi:thiamine biosynthesis lipoprotein
VATRAGAAIGTGYTDHVIGRTEYITWLCAVGHDGRIRRMEVLSYREPIGGEVAGRRWLEEFTGLGPEDDLRRGRPITNLAGATLSVDAMTERARFLLDWHAVVVAPEVARRWPAAVAAPEAPWEEAIPVGTASFRLRIAPGGPNAAAVAQAAREAALRGNAVLNQWESTSELARLNAAGGGQPSPDLARLLTAVDGWHRLTVGTFDPTVGPLVEALAAGRAADPTLIGWTRVRHGPAQVELAPGMRLDLGGVMKGWILDAAREAAAPLLAPGQSLALDFGQSSHAVAGGPVTITIRHPANPEQVLHDLVLAPGQALGIAHARGRTFRQDGVERSHLINPRTGASASLERAAIVLAPSAALADALDTALCLLPIPEALAVAQRAGVEALLWDAAGPHPTPGWPGRPQP